MSPLFDVVVFGEALVDMFGETAIVGGAPLNVARHLAGLGFKPLLITRIGDDANGALVIDEMHRFGMSTKGVQVDETLPTGKVLVEEIAPGSHRFVILKRQAYDAIDLTQAMAALGGSLDAIRAVYFGSLIQRSAIAQSTLQGLLSGLSGQRVFDMNWRDDQVDIACAAASVDSADQIKLNDDELYRLARHRGLHDIELRAPPALNSDYPQLGKLLDGGRARSLVVTFGGAGYAAFSREGRCIARGEARPIAQIVDTVGAGDAFVAALLASQLAGWPLARQLEHANAFAAAACSWRGAVSADLQMYTRWRAQWRSDDPASRFAEAAP